jgi:hypothetical protein
MERRAGAVSEPVGVYSIRWARGFVKSGKTRVWRREADMVIL